MKDVPEAIALAFSIAILHLLCQPYYSPDVNNGCYTAPSVGENTQIEKPRRIHKEDLLFVVTAGYHANYVQSNSYLKFTVLLALVVVVVVVAVVAVVDAVDAVDDIKLTKF